MRLLSQVVLLDISAHVTHLEGTQTSGKIVSETFVSIHAVSNLHDINKV